MSPGKAEGGLGTAWGQAGSGAEREKQENPGLEGIWELCWCGGQEGRFGLPDIPVLPSWGFQSPFQRLLSWDVGAGSQKTLSIPKSPIWSNFWEGKERWEHPQEQQGCLGSSHGNYCQPFFKENKANLALCLGQLGFFHLWIHELPPSAASSSQQFVLLLAF